MVSTPTIGRRSLLKSVGAAAGVGSVGIAGCTGGTGSGGSGGGAGAGTETPKEVQLVYGGGPQAETAYQLAVGWGQLLREETGGRIRMNVQATSGPRESMKGVARGTFDMTSSTTPSIWRAAAGKKPFEKKYAINIMFTTAIGAFPIGFTTTKHEDIKYLEDLHDKRVVTGAPGDLTHFYWTSYCKANDIPVKTQKFMRVPESEGYRLVKQGRADAVIAGTDNGRPEPATEQWLTRIDNEKMITPKKGERSIALGEYVGGGVVWNLDLTKFGDAWKNSAVSDRETIRMIAGTTTQLTSLENMSDETGYTITDITIEKRDKLPKYHSMWEGFANNPEKYAMAMRMQDAKAAPYHPGVAKALKEHGIWNEEFPIAERG